MAIERVEEFFPKVLSTWQEKERFIAAFKCAEWAALIIDKVCKEKFRGGSGALANSFNPVPAVVKGEGLTAGAYSPLPYAAIRETGGTIKPKSPRKALAVPLTKKAKNTGSPLLWSSGKPLVYIPPKRGASDRAAGVFATAKGRKTKKKKQQFEAQYMLRYYAPQKATGYLTIAANRAAPGMQKIVGDAVSHLFASVHVFEVE